MFDGVENFRDFGGFGGRFGVVPPGRLFRSAQLTHATEPDRVLLGSLGLGAIVDLRRRRERAEAPSRLPASYAGVVFGSDEEADDAEAPHRAFFREGDLSDAAIERFLLRHYRETPFDPVMRRVFGDAFRFLAEGRGALLVHCAAGKDRTGLLAALIRVTLGAHPDDVRADYLRSNASLMTEPRLDVFRSFLRDLLGGAEPSDAMLLAMTGVSVRHLDAAFAAIEANGGIDAYLASIGADAARVRRVRAKLIR